MSGGAFFLNLTRFITFPTSVDPIRPQPRRECLKDTKLAQGNLTVTGPRTKDTWNAICSVLRIRDCVARTVGAKCYTPEIVKSGIPFEMPLKVHGDFPVTIHWTCDNPMHNTGETWNYLGKRFGTSIWTCHWKSTMISEVLISGAQSFAPRLCFA